MTGEVILTVAIALAASIAFLRIVATVERRSVEARRASKCAGCRHVRRGPVDRLVTGWRFARCVHPHVLRSNGDDVPSFCNVERDLHFDSINACGSSGKLYSPTTRGEEPEVVA